MKRDEHRVELVIGRSVASLSLTGRIHSKQGDEEGEITMELLGKENRRKQDMWKQEAERSGAMDVIRDRLVGETEKHSQVLRILEEMDTGSRSPRSVEQGLFQARILPPRVIRIFAIFQS
jgi:hypothetical protein